MKSNNILLQTAYLPPIQYFTKFLQNNEIIIEQHDNYQKQTFRNRCHIYSPNGIQVLTVPVIKNHGTKTKVKDIKISYAEKWYINHIRSIEAAYRSSPFYEFYMPEIELILKKKQKFLLDLNQELLAFCIEALDLDIQINYTNEFIKASTGINDFREIIHPKRYIADHDSEFKPMNYYQCFQEKFGFIENLSIIDILLNEGPNALEILKSSISYKK